MSYKTMRSTPTKRKILKKIFSDKPIKPNTWKLLKGGSSPQHPDVLIGCDVCELRHIIGMNHNIDENGVVMPSVGVPKMGRKGDCGYHEWIKLDGWSKDK